MLYEVITELNKLGRPNTKDRQCETDIAVFRGMLGADFQTLLKQPAPILNAFGAILRNLRGMTPGPQRSEIRNNFV